MIGANAENEINAVSHTNAGEDAGEIGANGRSPQAEGDGDFLVLLALQDQFDNARLPWRKPQRTQDPLPFLGTEKRRRINNRLRGGSSLAAHVRPQ